jgi:hypothetical protein
MNATPGGNAVHNTAATTLAARFPALCRAASRPNALPRIGSGDRVATTACSACSDAPMPTPANTNPTASIGTLGPTPAKSK